MNRKNIILSVLTVLLFSFSLTLSADLGRDLRRAAKHGEIEKVKQLLKKGVNANSAGKRGGTPLIKAAQSGNIEIVQLLLSHGGDPGKENYIGRSALDVADRHDEYVIFSIMSDGIKEQLIQFSNKMITESAFSKVMRDTFIDRGYRITKNDTLEITGVYDKNGRQYKVMASIKDDKIKFQFLRGYGANRLNYLLNLKKDFIERLK